MMRTTIQYRNTSYEVDLNQPIDISIPLTDHTPQVNCFHAPQVEITPLVAGDFIGSIEAGSPVNFMNVKINPHGNGTHTECLSHICSSDLTIHQALSQYHFIAQLITIDLEKSIKGAITLDQLKAYDLNHETLIIRTTPNDKSKWTRNYSGSNPPYIEVDAIEFIVDRGIKHLLIDLPSVDPEVDGGKLAAHKAFWKVPNSPRKDATITELVYVSNEIIDGLYLLNIQIISLEMDASPSKPVLYELRS